jgi:hypothetical protein
MRFGLADVRNYDSVELASSLAWLAPLYLTASAGPSSRSEISWDSVAAARDRLVRSGVGAIVAAVPPPAAAVDRFEQVGRVWIAWLDHDPWATVCSPRSQLDVRRDHGWARLIVNAPAHDRVVMRESWDPGWTALLDGKPAALQPEWGVFLAVDVPPGRHELILKYEPAEVRLGLAVSVAALVGSILVLTGIRLFGFLE